MIFFFFFLFFLLLHIELRLPHAHASLIYILTYSKKKTNTNDDDSPVFLDVSPPTSKKTNDFYQSSLSPVKRLLNESIDSNIEIIQMDEQECILEIVDGVLTIVPKDKSISSSSVASDADKVTKKKHRKHYGKKVYEQMFAIFLFSNRLF
jgi:hypothetical protein